MAEEAASLWAAADRADALALRQRLPRRRFRWVLGALPSLVLISGLALAVMLPRTLPPQARVSLFVFGSAAILWTLSRLSAAYVAIGAVLLLALTGAIEQESLFETLEADVIWLMIGAFILGEAVCKSGLADRLTRAVCRGRRSVERVFWLVSAALLALTFLIPSTSGRAAVTLPLFRTISQAAGDRQVTRALALLIPAVILVSTISTLVGAGSHLIANDLLDEVVDQSIGFGQWLLYGLPFGVAASVATCYAVTRLFIPAATRALALRAPPAQRVPLSSAEKKTSMVALGMVALWLTHGLHGLEIATTGFLGAFLLTLPLAGVISWKAGLKAISWNLVLFVGAALVLGEALVETGAAEWLIGRMFSAAGLSGGKSPPLLLLSGLVLLTLTSHIYLTSHAARAAALVPPLLYMAGALNANPVAVMFIATVGMNYCLTFPVSSKALLMFQELREQTWAPADLLRLSAVLLPAHAVLIVLFYYGYWRHVGLAL